MSSLGGSFTGHQVSFCPEEDGCFDGVGRVGYVVFSCRTVGYNARLADCRSLRAQSSRLVAGPMSRPQNMCHLDSRALVTYSRRGSSGSESLKNVEYAKRADSVFPARSAARPKLYAGVGSEGSASCADW